MSRFFHYDTDAGRVVEGHALAEERTGDWPAIECYASGVHADQAQELRDYFKQRGECVEVTSAGDPVYASSAQRRRCLKMRGMHDRNSFS